MADTADDDGRAGMLRELEDWLAERPEVHERALAWPPGCKVMAADGCRLIAPAPGIVGTVIGYNNDGTIAVEAPLQHHTISVSEAYVSRGELVWASCDPEALEFLEYDLVSREDVAAAIAARRP